VVSEAVEVVHVEFGYASRVGVLVVGKSAVNESHVDGVSIEASTILKARSEGNVLIAPMRLVATKLVAGVVTLIFRVRW